MGLGVGNRDSVFFPFYGFHLHVCFLFLTPHQIAMWRKEVWEMEQTLYSCPGGNSCLFCSNMTGSAPARLPIKCFIYRSALKPFCLYHQPPLQKTESCLLASNCITWPVPREGEPRRGRLDLILHLPILCGLEGHISQFHYLLIKSVGDWIYINHIYISVWHRNKIIYIYIFKTTVLLNLQAWEPGVEYSFNNKPGN